LHDLSIQRLTQKPRVQTLHLMIIMLGVLTTPYDVVCPQALMLYKREVWRPRGTFW